ncbi:MarR family winged helix-turn-helix transcriptional regulator [Allokutzneria multivorans]
MFAQRAMPVLLPPIPADRELWSTLTALFGQVEAALERALQRGYGLSLSEYRAVCALAESDLGYLRMQDLADAVGLNQSSISRLVARLERAGLTTRKLCETDRRGVCTEVTERGRSVCERAVLTYEVVLTAELDRAAAEPRFSAMVDRIRG